ncbi:MAG: HisA/HisF-related TIM barrel protein [Candidatus Dormibacteria bacterium]
MIVVPAIDVRRGRCVRLIQGDYGRETVYENDPSGVASRLIEQGARRLHVVDLDAARGRADDTSTAAVTAVIRVAASLGADVEVGGGVRDEASARHWFDLGAAMVVLGSLAVRDPDTAARVCNTFPDRCLVALDVRDGVARAQGWTEAAGAAATHLTRWSHWPLAGLIRTNIADDGMLGGPDVDGVRETVAAFDRPVFASGGVSTVDDVALCAAAGAAGVIVGRAIYEGRFDLRAALQRFRAGAARS